MNERFFTEISLEEKPARFVSKVFSSGLVSLAAGRTRRFILVRGQGMLREGVYPMMVTSFFHCTPYSGRALFCLATGEPQKRLAPLPARQ
jgi:hypothetical protein